MRQPGPPRSARRPQRGADRRYRLEVDFATAALGGKQRSIWMAAAIEVVVPPGAEHGSTLRLKGQGDGDRRAGPRATPWSRSRSGRIRVHAPGSRRARRTADQRAEAILGASVPVPTIDGPVRITVPAGSNSGRTLRLRGRGIVQPDGRRGDQYVRLLVVLPQAPDWNSRRGPGGATTTCDGTTSRGERSRGWCAAQRGTPAPRLGASPPDRERPAHRLAGAVHLMGAWWPTRQIALGLRILWHAIVHLIYDGGMTYAGHIAFMTLFSLFPFLIFLHHARGRAGSDGRGSEFIAIGLNMLPAEVSGVIGRRSTRS